MGKLLAVAPILAYFLAVGCVLLLILMEFRRYKDEQRAHHDELMRTPFDVERHAS